MRTAPTWLIAGLLALVLTGLGPPIGAQQPLDERHFDVLIRGGRVLDGAGNPWFRADVGVQDGRIVAVGRLPSATASEEVDARGLHVAPGFIDVHSHAGGGLATEDRSHARPLLAQGITTVVVNPDGGGPVDLATQRRELLEDGLGVHAALLVPHGSIRNEVLGMEDRPPTETELERMRALVRTGMEEGAFGLSSGVFYAPGSFADTDELVALSSVIAEFGGVYTSHIRDESNYTIGVLEAVEEVIAVAREAEVRGIVTHVKALGPPVWGFSEAIALRVERARDEGVEVFADQYPYTASATGLAAALVPRWAQAGGDASFEERLADAEARRRIEREMHENLARRGGAERIQFRRFEEDPSLEGRTLDAVARERGVDPVDLTLELLQIGAPAIVSFNMLGEDVERLMRRPWTMTGSDGGLPEWEVGVPHPRSYGAFPRKLRQYVVEDGVLTLEEAVRSMTGLSATVFGMEERGFIRTGAVADVVVFDLDEVHDPATFTDPHQLAEGMEHVLVNGEFAIRDGAFTGVRAGEVLRGGR